jgi:hypothetical protein
LGFTQTVPRIRDSFWEERGFLPDPFEWIDLFLAIDVRSNDEQKYFCDRV